MMQDHLLFTRLQSMGLAGMTFRPSYPDADTLCLAHDRAYVDGFLQGTLSPKEMRRIGLPWSQALVQRTLIGTGSAILAGRLALSYGLACMTNGGTHHAHRSHGSGWCILNDQAISARALQRDAGVRRVAFIDLDVHQGDGTATIFNNDPDVFVFSMHCVAQSFPEASAPGAAGANRLLLSQPSLRSWGAQPPMPKDVHPGLLQLQRSNLDVALAAGTGDEDYLSALRSHLPTVLEEFRPEVVFYNAGVDVHEEDSLGKLHLTTRGIFERDRTVFSECLARGVPVAAAIGGGYCEDHSRLVDRHLMLHLAAREVLCGIPAGDLVPA